MATRRRRTSDDGLRLREKQKLRFHYGLREVQLVRHVLRAAHRAGRPDLNLLCELELRLDNVVFRLGLAPTIPAARQIIVHGYLLLNGHRVSMPSMRLRPGDELVVRPIGRDLPAVLEAARHGPELAVPSYLERNADGSGGRVVGEPARTDVPVEVNESMVIEHYARR